MPAPYYDFTQKNWSFIVLDGNDLSLHAYPKANLKHKASLDYYTSNYPKAPQHNGAIGPKQLQWLGQKLQVSEEANENVIPFCHFPIYPKNNHNLWNSNELITLLEKHSCVKAYINGHNHKAKYAQKAGIHYLTVKGIVTNRTATYGIIELTKTQLFFHGQVAE